MARNSRRLNQPITLQVRDTTRNAIGGQKDDWVLLRSTFAFVEDKTFLESIEAGRRVPVVGKEFTVRRDNTLDASNNSILYLSERYNIRSIKVDDRNKRSPYTIIQAVSGVAQ